LNPYCGTITEGDPVITTTKEEYCHCISVAPQWDDCWEGEEAEESLCELQYRVKGNRVAENADLFKQHPSHDYEISQRSR
jgi:hypothetical protein